MARGKRKVVNRHPTFTLINLEEGEVVTRFP